MDRLTDLAVNKDAASFKDAFEERVSEKVFNALEAAKIEVAQSLFNQEEINEHGNDGFGSHKTTGNVTKGWPSPKHPGQGLPKTKKHKHVEEAKMCPHCEKPMSKCSCEHMEEEVEQVFEVRFKEKSEDGEMKKVREYVKNIRGGGEKDGHGKITSIDPWHESLADHHLYRFHPNHPETSKSTEHGKPIKSQDVGAHLLRVIGVHKKTGKIKQVPHYMRYAPSVSNVNEEVEQIDEGMHKHEKKHGKMHHKLAKKMMKLAHKHAKKHYHEEEEE